jgi:hypothetical protein
MNVATTYQWFQYVTQILARGNLLSSGSSPCVGAGKGISPVFSRSPASSPKGRWSHLRVAARRI